MSTEQERIAAISEIENTIRRLRGVVSAHVSPNERGEIKEIHVVTDETRHPKQVSRDIESILLSEMGVQIDHRKISIAQLRETGLPTLDTRPKFLNIDLSINRAEMEVKVNLGVGEDIFSGASRSGRDEERLDSIAQATAAAISEYLRSYVDSDISTVEIKAVLRNVTPGVGEIVTVALRLTGPRGEENLIGSALVKESAWQATAYATLDAINRRLTRLAG